MESRAGPSTSRRLRVNWADLADAFDDASLDVSAYLDLDTGDVVPVTAEVGQELEAIYVEVAEEPPEEEAYRAAFAAALERRRPPAWMHELLEEADALEGGLGTRFIRVPNADSREGYGDMPAFIETVTSRRLQESLWDALRGRGAFRRFKDVLAGYPGERERWFAFKDSRPCERVRAWLADEGIELMDTAD